MEGFLSNSQREYVLFHLNLHVALTFDVRSKFIFIEDNAEDIHTLSNRIVFTCSQQALSLDNILYVNNLPILFPLQGTNDLYHSDERGNLIFSHDLIKSIFYLLSGYQEYANTHSRDNLNRFSYEDSIQNKLGITDKPVVNYYFDSIVNGITEFCNRNTIPVKKRRLFKNFGFILTHDVDRVDLYTLNYLLYKIKEIFRAVKSRLDVLTNIKLLITGIFKYLNFRNKENPYWNFVFLRQVEKQHNFKSVFFFLDKGVRHSDAYYSFYEPRFQNLFRQIQEEGCEIGLHGTVGSSTDQKIMSNNLHKLHHASKAPIVGNRQHRLLWKHPDTALMQHAIGLKYDTTLGFAAHEGFRNSYCMPFKLYDFSNDKMIDLWEFPMNVMDGTLLFYRNYTTQEALLKCLKIIEEIKKFGGVFTLLWHNSFFDEVAYPGVTVLYQDLLKKISASEPENLVGADLVKKLHNYSND